MRFDKAKCKVLHMGCGNLLYQYKLGDKTMEQSPAKKDFRVLVDGRLDVSQQYALTAQKANCILGCIRRSKISRSREVILPLCAGETSPGVQHSDVESSVQEGHGPIGACSEEGHKNDPRDGTPLK